MGITRKFEAELGTNEKLFFFRFFCFKSGRMERDLREAGDPPALAHFPFVPVLRLFGEGAAVPSDDDSDEPERETVAGLASLRFRYPDGRFTSPGAPPESGRDLSAEAEAARYLETFGALDLSYVSDVLFDFDSEANYLIALEGQAHVGASFSAYAVTKLRDRGFEVELNPSFPFLAEAPQRVKWRATVDPSEDLNWFSLEIGIEVEGKAYNLVPALLELLEHASDKTNLSSLVHCPARFRAVPIAEGRYVVLPWPRLKRILDVLSDLLDGGAQHSSLRLPSARVDALFALDEAARVDGGELSWPNAEDFLERGRVLAEKPEFRAPPAGLRATLRPYQMEGLAWLEHKRDAGVGAVLADDMGLGKTLQTIALLAKEREARRSDRPSVIVAPTSLVPNWLREIERFAPHLKTLDYTGPRRTARLVDLARADVVVTSYPILIRDTAQLSSFSYHYAILDEAQAIKNSGSQANSAVRLLSARHRLAITGTPVENHLGELWSLFEFTLPGLLGSKVAFQKRYRDPVEREGNEARLVELRQKVSPFILRRVKEAVARELPAKTELIRSVDLSGQQRDLYESIRLTADSEVRAAIHARGISASTVTILDALTKLRQVCCDPRLLSVESAQKVRSSAKYELFFELLGAQLASGRRVLVFSQFAKMLGLLSQGLQTRNIEHLMLTGQSLHRQRLVDAFEAGAASVFLISLKAGGTGLNLVSADTVIHYDPWWNAAAQMQATDRAYRIGQKKPVFVYNLIVNASVEARMLALQQKKRQLADTLLGSTGGVSAWSEDDIKDLFAPLPGDDMI